MDSTKIMLVGICIINLMTFLRVRDKSLELPILNTLLVIIGCIIFLIGLIE